MDASSFKKINFGESSAEKEKAHSPNLLLEGFLDERGDINEVIAGARFLIYGQKGSGKSAICSRVELIADSRNLSVKTYTLERLNYNAFEGMDTKKEAPEIKNTRSWEMVLHTALLGMYSNDPNLKSISGKKKAKQVIKELQRLNILPIDDIYSLVKKVSKSELTANVEVIKYKNETQKKFDYTKLYDNLRVAVNDSQPSKKCILFIDGLDSVITTRDNQKNVLSGLLRASKIINEEMQTNSINVKIVVLCRTDLLNMLSDPNKQKIIDDYGLELNWYQHGLEHININLIKLLNLRAKTSLEKEIDIFSEFFPKTTGNKETFKFILDYTRYIPRDLIRLMNEIKKMYVKPMQKNHFITAIKEYSSNYLYGEIRDELLGIAESEKQVEDIFNLLSEMKKYRTSQVELQNKAKELGIDVNVENMLPLLFNIGAIGNVKVINGKDMYSFKFRERRTVFSPKDEIVIHLALQNLLKVRGGYENVKEIDYD